MMITHMCTSRNVLNTRVLEKQQFISENKHIAKISWLCPGHTVQRIQLRGILEKYLDFSTILMNMDIECGFSILHMLREGMQNR